MVAYSLLLPCKLQLDEKTSLCVQACLSGLSFHCSSKGHGKIQEQELVVIGSVDCVLSTLLKVAGYEKDVKRKLWYKRPNAGFDV